jgi:hypothetical protein
MQADSGHKKAHETGGFQGSVRAGKSADSKSRNDDKGMRDGHMPLGM